MRGSFASHFSHQLCMPFYRLLYPLRLDADVALYGRCGTVLQEPLNKGNIIAVVFVYLCCIPLAEAVGADAIIAKVVADNGKLLCMARSVMGKISSFDFIPLRRQ